MKRRKKTVEVWKSDELPANTILEFRAWVENIIELIPQEFLESAKVDILCYERFGCCTFDFEVSYTREETDDEHNFRVREAEKLKQWHEENQKELYLKLKKKYEG